MPSSGQKWPGSPLSSRCCAEWRRAVPGGTGEAGCEEGLVLLHLPPPPPPYDWQAQGVCLSPRMLVVLTTSCPSSQGLPFLWSGPACPALHKPQESFAKGSGEGDPSQLSLGQSNREAIYPK